MGFLFSTVISCVLIFSVVNPVIAENFTASYYTVKSCLREGTSGIMANGRRLNDEALTCASWDYKFGTKLRITNTQNGRSVICIVTDRGPAKKLYRKGRIVDLSKCAFMEIASLKQGIIPCKVEVFK